MSEADRHPPVLRAMLLAAGDDAEARDAIVRGFYGGMEGARHSVAVYQAVTLSAVYNAVRRDLGSSIVQISKSLKESAAEQGELTRKELAEQMDTGRQQDQAANEKQLQLFRSNLQDIRQKEAQLAEQKAKSWQDRAFWHGLTAAAAIVLTAAGFFWWNGQREASAARQAAAQSEAATAAAENRYYANMKAMGGAAAFVSEMNDAGCNVESRRTENGGTRITFSFGTLHVDQVEKKANQAIIDLAPVQAPSSPTRQASTAHR